MRNKLSPIDVVKTYLQGFRAQDIDSILAVLADDVIVYEPASSPYPGAYHGRAGYREMFERFHHYWVEKKVGAGGRIVGDEEVAVVIGTLLGRPRGHQEWLDVPVMERFRVVDNMITEIMPFYFDAAALPAPRDA